MRLLVLGGGGFLGFHVVAEAVGAGHQVTVFGRSPKAPLDGVEVLTGDRRGDLSALRGRSWDAVLDTFTDTDPGAPAVRATADLLSGAVGGYGYVSGMSVYAPAGPSRPDESGPVRRAGHEPGDDPLQERSLAKLAAEAVLADVFDGPVLLPRVGIMVGPRDPSHRFTWWPLRFHRALTGAAPRVVPAPGDPGRPVQYSDARDIAGWVVAMLAAGRGGVFNTVGPGRDQPLVAVLAACLTAARETAGGAGGSEGDVRLDWTGEDELRDLLDGVEEEQRPLWFPEDQIPQTAIDSAAAVRAGLRFRPALDTARDTLRWALDTGADGLVAGPFERRVNPAQSPAGATSTGGAEPLPLRSSSDQDPAGEGDRSTRLGPVHHGIGPSDGLSSHRDEWSPSPRAERRRRGVEATALTPLTGETGPAAGCAGGQSAPRSENLDGTA